MLGSYAERDSNTKSSHTGAPDSPARAWEKPESGVCAHWRLLLPWHVDCLPIALQLRGGVSDVSQNRLLDFSMF